MTRALAAAIMSAFLAAAPAAAEDLAVGLAGPMTGRYAVYGAELRAGAELAVENINTAGGVLGRKVALRIEDDACSRELAAAAARRLVAEGIRFVVGHFCSGASLAAAGIYIAAGTIQMVPAETGGWPSDAPTAPTLFHLMRYDVRQGEVAGRFLAARYTGRRIAILHDRTVYGRDLADDARQAMRLAGLQEVYVEAIRPGEKDYGAVIGKLKTGGIDVLYFGGFPTEAAIIVRELRAQGLSHLVLFGGDALATHDFPDQAGGAGEGTLLTLRYDASSLPSAAGVVYRLRGRGHERTRYALLAYAAIQAWAASVSAAGSLETAAVATRITEGTTTVLGGLTFDTKRRSSFPAFAVHAWRSGALEQVD